MSNTRPIDLPTPPIPKWWAWLAILPLIDYVCELHTVAEANAATLRWSNHDLSRAVDAMRSQELAAAKLRQEYLNLAAKALTLDKECTAAKVRKSEIVDDLDNAQMLGESTVLSCLPTARFDELGDEPVEVSPDFNVTRRRAEDTIAAITRARARFLDLL